MLVLVFVFQSGVLIVLMVVTVRFPSVSVFSFTSIVTLSSFVFVLVTGSNVLRVPVSNTFCPLYWPSTVFITLWCGDFFFVDSGASASPESGSSSSAVVGATDFDGADASDGAEAAWVPEPVAAAAGSDEEPAAGIEVVSSMLEQQLPQTGSKIITRDPGDT